MNKAQIKKTDNSFLTDKIKIRINTLEKINKKTITILDAYAGDSVIWNNIKNIPEYKNKLKIIKIEKEKKGGIYLKGNNIKYLLSMNLNKFDLIDLDAYGIPYKQLKILFQKKYKGQIVITAIQSGLGGLPDELLIDLGYTKKMIKKCPTLFSKNGIEKLLNYLGNNGIKTANIISINRKNYLSFSAS